MTMEPNESDRKVESTRGLEERARTPPDSAAGSVSAAPEEVIDDVIVPPPRPARSTSATSSPSAPVGSMSGTRVTTSEVGQEAGHEGGRRE